MWIIIFYKEYKQKKIDRHEKANRKKRE